MLLLVISLLAGALTVLAPCVLPLLPVIIGGSIGRAADKSRPYVIAAALAVSVILFTLLFKVSTILAGVPPQALSDFSGGLLIALGLVAILPEAWERLMTWLQSAQVTDRILQQGAHSSGLIGPILTGVALGPVFASCSPTYAFILASILPRDLLSGLAYLLAYTLGLVATLLAAALLGRRLTGRLGWAIDTHGMFRRVLGAIFVIIGLVVVTGQEVPLEVWAANHLPFDEARLEQLLLNTQHSGLTAQVPSGNSVLNVVSTPAPEFAGLTNWINSAPLTMASLRGKVVLVDFWTYSCINCLRTLPYVEKWYQAYASRGLVVVGVSAPEFAFEHDPTNVAMAVKKYGILYPVALDNDYQTWTAFNNDSWPAEYLIDQSGNIRYESIGEGDYPTTERAIQQLLGIKQALTTPTANVPISASQTPETYFGTNRASDFVGSPQLSNGTNSYSLATNLGQDEWSLGGHWQVAGENITSAGTGAKLSFSVYAKDVYMVAGSSGNTPQNLTVSLSSGSSSFGSDAPGGTASISVSRLYHLVSQNQAQQITVTLTVPPGVSLYTFTFGS